jgi:hypothetical protein
MLPGNILRKCSGKDLTRKGAKSKGTRLMVLFPSQFGFKDTNCEGTLGTIEKANTENPEFVIQTSKVKY